MSALTPDQWTEHSDRIPVGYKSERFIIHHCEQGSEEWEQIRKGRPTASRFSEILTPTGQLSKSATKYAMELLGECYVPGWSEFSGNKFTDRGTELEPEAIKAFSDLTGYEVKKVGFVTRKDGIVGCSPDGFIVDAETGEIVSGVEVKCESPKVHIENVLGACLPAKHAPQVHGSMAVTGLDSWEFFSYFPGMRPLWITVYRDEYTEKLSAALDQFLIDYAALRAKAVPLLTLSAGND